MAFSVKQINDEEKQKILSFEESHFLDVKCKDIKPSRLTRSLSAFSNSEGGELYIGLLTSDSRDRLWTWAGFASQEEANGHIQAFESLFPLGNHCQYQFIQHAKSPGLLLHLLVHKSPDIKKASDTKTYVRRNAQNIPLDDEGVQQLRYSKGIVSFETLTLDVPITAISNSETLISFVLNVVPTMEPEVFLQKQLLINRGKPTVAGIILFADEPQAYIPKRCGIKIYRYKTKEIAGTRDTLAFDPITVEGCAYDQIKEAVGRAVSVIQEISVMGEEGLEKCSYPQITLHEIITNAVLHRDYSIVDDIHIRIFDNRIEVESPGRLPGHITTRNILEERFSRNGTIVRLINKFPSPPNKDVGEGLRAAFEEMRKLRLKEPEVRENENSVTVIIKHEPLASPEELIIDYLKSNPSIANRKAREICAIGSENAVKRIFIKMQEKKLIERIPELRGSKIAYRLTRNDVSSKQGYLFTE